MKAVALFFLLAFATVAVAQDHPKNTMRVKRKDGTYKCRASETGKESCCALGNTPTPTPKPNKK